MGEGKHHRNFQLRDLDLDQDLRAEILKIIESIMKIEKLNVLWIGIMASAIKEEKTVALDLLIFIVITASPIDPLASKKCSRCLK